jgi:tetratricopeptide (TPR) repeat protein
LAFPLAENLLATLPELDGKILRYHRRLESSPRSDNNRPTLLRQLAGLRCQRHALSNQKSDLDKAITHLTEAVLLPPTQDLLFAFFRLAALLCSRVSFYPQPNDVKSSIKYFRFLHVNFHSLESFDIPHTSGDLSSLLFHALAYNLVLTPDDMVQNLEEMVPLIPEFITTDILTYLSKRAVEAFIPSVLAVEIFCRKDTQLVANRVIQVLREATVLNPDLLISNALATCLAARFKATPVMNDYEEAIAIFDRIVATHSPGNSPASMQRNTMMVISSLLMSRLDSFSRPEYLEDAIRRIRSFVPYLLDEDRISLTSILNSLTRRRSDYFGVARNSGGAPLNNHFYLDKDIVFHGVLPAPGIMEGSQMKEKLLHLHEVTSAIINGEIPDVEAAVERSRKFVPFHQSKDKWSSSSQLVKAFASMIFHAYQSTKRSGYLNDSITTLRDLFKISAPNKAIHFHVGYMLLRSLIPRLKLFHYREDFEELMQLCPELANDASGEVFTRFNIPCFWANAARVYMHPSASIAYETAMSLLQETLIFCPTLQTQHLRLSQAFRGNRLPLDYASYQIQNGQVKEAVGTLERGRALIWSEMRGLRTSTDQLRAADPALADKFADINQRLESVTMSVAHDEELGRGETGTEPLNWPSCSHSAETFGRA